MTISTNCCFPFKFSMPIFNKKPIPYEVNCSNCLNDFNIFDLVDRTKLTEGNKIAARKMLIEKFKENKPCVNGQSSQEVVTAIVSNLIEIRHSMVKSKNEDSIEKCDEDYMSPLLQEINVGCKLLNIETPTVLCLVKKRPSKHKQFDCFYKPVPENLKKLIQEVGMKETLTISKPIQQWVITECDYNGSFKLRRPLEIIQPKGRTSKIVYNQLIKPLPEESKEQLSSVTTHNESKKNSQEIKFYESEISQEIEINEDRTYHKIGINEDRTYYKIKPHDIKMPREEYKDYEEKEQYNENHIMESTPRISITAQDKTTKSLDELLITARTTPNNQETRESLSTWWEQNIDSEASLSVTYYSRLSIEQIESQHQLSANLVRVIEKHTDRRAEWIQNEIRDIVEEIAGHLDILIFHITQTHKQEIDKTNNIIQVKKNNQTLYEKLLNPLT